MNLTHRRRKRARRGEGEVLRDEILDATEALLAESGDIDKVSIRSIATAVGVTPPSIYMHFDGKDALVFAVCNRHFRSFRDALKDSDDPRASASDRLKAMGRAYYEWGVSNPEAYRLMFMDKSISPPPGFPDEELHGKHALLDLAAVIAAGVNEGAFEAGDLVATTMAVWAHVHGITAIKVAMDNPDWDEHMPEHDDRVVLERVLEMCARSLHA